MIAPILIAIVGLLLVIVLLDNADFFGQSWIFEAPERKAGRAGEEKAANIIGSILRENDRLFTNVQISYEGKPAELDNVIVNKYGVFIIEVKNYNGTLVGNEDDSNR